MNKRFPHQSLNATRKGANFLEARSARSNRIFFLASDIEAPSGGRAFVYHLVDILVRNGFDACVLHQTQNFRYRWFENTTPVRWTDQIKRSRIKNCKQWLRFQQNKIKTSWSQTLQATERTAKCTSVNPQDILVIPETRAAAFHKIFPGVPKIILNQNPYFFFQDKGLKTPELSLHHPDIKGCIAMSKLDYEMHCLVAPKNTWHVPYFIDADRYHYAEVKKRQIAYMPRRLKKDADAVINLLKIRNRLQGFTFVPIAGMSQQRVSQVLQDSLMFLSFSHREGFGLPPAEAIACGCLVIGYSGNGGDEFFDKDVAFKVPHGDLARYVKTVESTLAEYVQAPEALNRFRRQASEYILQTYSKAETNRRFLTAWNGVVQGIGET